MVLDINVQEQFIIYTIHLVPLSMWKQFETLLITAFSLSFNMQGTHGTLARTKVYINIMS